MIAGFTCTITSAGTAIGQSANEPVATVDGETIGRTDLQERVQLATAITAVADTPDNHPDLQRRVLARCIDERLQLANAKKNGIAVTDIDVRELVQRISVRNGGPPDQLRSLLEANRVPFRALEEQLRAMAYSKLVRRRILPRASEPDINGAMRRSATATRRDHVRLGEIFLAASRLPADDAGHAAAWLRARLVDGSRFGSMAFLLSQNASPEGHGDMGWYAPGTLESAIEDAVADLQPGQLSGPVSTDQGWHILTVLDRRAPGTPDPDEERVHLTQMILPLAVGATAAEVEKLASTAREIMEQVHSCRDLRGLAGTVPGATVNDIENLRIRDMPQHMRDALRTAPVGRATGPFRSRHATHTGLGNSIQILAICDRRFGEVSSDRETMAQHLRRRSVEIAARQYMISLRRNARIEISL